mgnify:CR=1 FL=1
MHAANAISNILLIRLDHMGDAILAAPMLDSLVAAFPQAHITCMASSRSAPVFEHDPRVKRVMQFDLQGTTRQEKWKMAQWVRTQKFDLVISLTEKFWAAMWSLASGSPLRIGFDAGIRQPLHFLWRWPSYTHRIEMKNDPFVASPLHEVERYMQLLEPVGIRQQAGPLKVHTEPAASIWAKEYLAGLKLLPDAIPVGFHFSALWGGEGWPQAVQSQIVQALLAMDERIVVIGTAGPGEAGMMAQLTESLPRNRFHLCQGMSFSQWVELVRQLQVYVSFETGSAHISAAACVPTVMVFPYEGFIHRSTRWRPWGVPYRMLQRPPIDSANARDFITGIVANLEELI